MCSALFIFGAPKTLLKLLKGKESLRKLEIQAETFSQYIITTGNFHFTVLDFNAIKCDELAELIAAICSSEHSARLYRWQGDGKIS